MRAWDRYWFEPVAAIRPYLLLRAVYAVLALDLWTVTLPRGGRYGFGGFDVAHFGWLEAVRPFPSPTVYVGLLLLVGCLALVCALCDPGRWLRAIIAVLHSYSWAMSLHDTFQHHYFLSIVLTALVFFPRLGARDVVAPARTAPPVTSAWAFVLLAVNVSIVYAFAAISKLDIAWRTGEILRQAPVSQLQPMQAWAESLGVPAGLFWGASALGVIALEATVAAGYLICVHRDTSRRRWVGWLALLTSALAIGFHSSAEVVLSLRIGWFTYYMIAIAAAYLLPAAWLHALGGPLLRAAAWLDARLSGGPVAGRRDLAIAAVAAAVLASVGVGLALDLPGAPAAGLGAAVAVAVAALAGTVLDRRATAPLACGVAGALAAVAMGAAVGASDARYEFYMAVGRQYDRVGQGAEATDAYAHAARYGAASPEGLWSSAGSVIRIRVRRGEATGIFTQVSDGARKIGFKPGDVSFEGRLREGFLEGRMILRFAGTCYPDGRVVPVIGLIRRDGDTMVTYFYNFAVAPDCVDVGAPTVANTGWDRIVGAR